MEKIIITFFKYLNKIKLNKLFIVILFLKEKINVIKKYLDYLMYLLLRNYIYIKFF